MSRCVSFKGNAVLSKAVAFLEFTRLCFVTSFHGLQERSFSEKSEISLCEFR